VSCRSLHNNVPAIESVFAALTSKAARRHSTLGGLRVEFCGLNSRSRRMHFLCHEQKFVFEMSLPLMSRLIASAVDLGFPSRTMCSAFSFHCHVMSWQRPSPFSFVCVGPRRSSVLHHELSPQPTSEHVRPGAFVCRYRTRRYRLIRRPNRT